jgi:hypothetical protein
MGLLVAGELLTRSIDNGWTLIAELERAGLLPEMLMVAEGVGAQNVPVRTKADKICPNENVKLPKSVRICVNV